MPRIIFTMETQSKLFEKKGYWTKYNQSQTQEKIIFLRLLYEICQTLPEQRLSNQVFCCCMKQYGIKSARRLIGDLELCKRAGYIDKVPHFNSVLNALQNSSLTSVFEDLIKLSAMPLRAIERKFCCDSTGFGLTTIHDRWSQIRQQYSKHHKYLKAHIAFGTLTNIVTACKITEGTSNDSPMLPGLVEETAKNFQLEEWSADKAYLSRQNLQAIFEYGALPLIPFKNNSTGKKRNSPIWQEMYKFFQMNRELFLKKYHLRSNAESGFFMIKQRFGDLTYLRNETGCINDVLAKVLCHNLCVLCQELIILGIDINFAQLSKEIAQR